MSIDIFSNSTEKGVFHNNNFKSYFEIKKEIQHLSHRLTVSDCAQGKMIGIYMQNSIDYIVAYFSVLSIEKIVVPIYRKLTNAHDLLNEIYNCDIYCVLTNNESFDAMRQAAQSCNRYISVINIENEQIQVFNSSKIDDISFENYDNVSVLLQSSGTSNNPKKIMHSFERLKKNMQLHVEAAQLTTDDRTLIELPMTFSYCNTAQMLAHIYLNANIYISQSYSPSSFISQVVEYGITNTTLVPSQLVSLSLSPNLTKLNNSSLKKVFYGGSLLNESVLKRLLTKCPNVSFINTYGQTEAGPRISINLSNTLSGKCGSAGKPLRDIDVEIRNTSELVGDIFVKTPCLMIGYYKNEALTQETIKDGWLDTGDIGFFDQDGYLYITGRKRNIIISGGINIYPEEIEAVLETHPSVKKAIVYGEANHLLGEIPCVEIEANSTIHDVEELKNYCKLYLSEYKVPYKITLTEKIDTTLNGKTKRLR